MKYFSLFSGIGGFEYGIEQTIKNRQQKPIGERTVRNNLQQAGVVRNSNVWRGESKQEKRRGIFNGVCVGYSEIDKYATAIYRYHYPEHRNYGDATKFVSAELPDFDLLVGGFPCQSFSIAGKRKGMSGEDIRGTLFFEIWRIARDKRPHTLLLENVPGLLSSQNGKDFQAILRSLDEIGYDVEWGCLNSKNFGVPQNRERVFIIGHIRGQGFKKVFPVEKTNTVYNETANCLDANYGKGWLDHGQRTMIVDINHIRQEGEPRIYDECRALDSAQGGGHVPLIYPCLNANDERKNFSGQAKNRLLKTGMIRRLIPTECERLQAFPDGWTKYGSAEFPLPSWRPDLMKRDINKQWVWDTKLEKHVRLISDTQRYKCLGNAVTTNVISAIVERLVR